MAPIKTTREWIALDWGTTHLRAWRISAGGSIVDSAKSNRGMSQLGQNEFEPALLELITPWLSEGKSISVIGCGMVGAKQGWMETPYTPVPCPPGTTAQKVETTDQRIDVFICGGLKQDNPADVMRGEETQVAGFLATNPEFEGIICLPGTHSKWVVVQSGTVVHFQTFISGEMFALLAEHSVLRHSIDRTQWNEDEFIRAVVRESAPHQGNCADLFSIRAESLLSNLSPAAGHARLSGIIIGRELAAASSFLKGADRVEIIGEPGIAQHYQTALNSLGYRSNLHSVEAMTIAGLSNAIEEVMASTCSGD